MTVYVVVGDNRWQNDRTEVAAFMSQAEADQVVADLSGDRELTYCVEPLEIGRRPTIRKLWTRVLNNDGSAQDDGIMDIVWDHPGTPEARMARDRPRGGRGRGPIVGISFHSPEEALVLARRRYRRIKAAELARSLKLSAEADAERVLLDEALAAHDARQGDV